MYGKALPFRNALNLSFEALPHESRARRSPAGSKSNLSERRSLSAHQAAKPHFSLTTNRSYSPNETARMWASYQNVEYLDFRVYRVKDPNKFFKQLDDPHQMGEKEKEAVSQGYGSRISILERTHRLKTSLFTAVRDYVRTHLLKEHRETFNQKFRKEQAPEQTPLNVATDYARVPLLNPDH